LERTREGEDKQAGKVLWHRLRGGTEEGIIFVIFFFFFGGTEGEVHERARVEARGGKEAAVQRLRVRVRPI
jgi:hypothetical protein